MANCFYYHGDGKLYKIATNSLAINVLPCTAKEALFKQIAQINILHMEVSCMELSVW